MSGERQGVVLVTVSYWDLDDPGSNSHSAMDVG